MIVPKELLHHFTSTRNGNSPAVKLRALSDINNRLGETYLLGDEQVMILFFGKLGKERETLELSFQDVTDAVASERKPFVFLEMHVGDESLKMKFPMFDLHKIHQFIEHYRRYRGLAEEQAVVEPIEAAEPSDLMKIPMIGELSIIAPRLTPRIGFAAALHAMAYVDDDLADEELKNLELIVRDKHILDAGLGYWRNKGTSELMKELAAKLEQPQKRCLLANLLELAMVDGTLLAEEQEFLEHVCNMFEIGSDDFMAIFDILYLKNNTTIFPTNCAL